MKRTILLTLLLLVTLGTVLVVTTKPVPAADNPVFEHEYVVVRAYFAERQMVDAVAAWREPWDVDHNKKVMVIEVTAVEYMQLLDMGFTLEIDEALTAEYNQPNVPLPGQGGGIPGYPCYRTVEETFATAEDIVAQHPDFASWIDIGDSWEKTQGLGGYDLMVLRLTNSNVAGPKPKLFIMSAVHAREYTTAELNTRFAEYLINNYGIDADATWLLDYHEMHLLLQANPDGRKQAEAGFSWRKNTNQNYCSPVSTNRGADLNRNFPYEWSNWGGSSSSQCSATYRGASAASEPETQAVINYVQSEYEDTRPAAPNDFSTPAYITTTGIFMDIHSYSELVLWSWGFSNIPTGNNTSMVTLGRKFAYFNDYMPQQAIELYVTDGTTDDFAYGELGLPAYTFELGTSFFQSCSVFENTILPDNLSALIYAAKAVRAPYVEPAGPDALDLALALNPVEAGTAVTLTATLNDTRYNNQNGIEPTHNIAAAEYYIDVPPWVTTTTPIAVPMTAVDGSFNNPIEAAQGVIDTTGLSEGQHTIFIRGQDANGVWGVFSAIFLNVGVAPTADFELFTPIILGDSAVFTNTSTGDDLEFFWDFGDGANSTDEHPTHLYAASGVYTVTLTVINDVGSDMATATLAVWQVPAASFSSSSPDTLGATTVFTNTSTGDNLQFSWDFGDGITSTLAAPTHVYTATGMYTVTLTVNNEVGSDSATAVVEITAVAPPQFTLYLPTVMREP